MNKDLVVEAPSGARVTYDAREDVWSGPLHLVALRRAVRADMALEWEYKANWVLALGERMVEALRGGSVIRAPKMKKGDPGTVY